MTRKQITFLFLNVGHFFDHLFMLIFATVVALALAREWQMSYAELILYATPGFIAFGVCAIPAGWIADKWNRPGMMVIFFVGIGLGSISTALAQSPLQIGVGLFFIGLFAAIYHPVGIAMVVHGRQKTGIPLAINGIFGNMGVACAALFTGLLIDLSGWRLAFALPGAVCMLIGATYAAFVYVNRGAGAEETRSSEVAQQAAVNTLKLDKPTLIRVFAIILFSTAIGGLIFQSTTFALPKIFAERIRELAGTATLVGWYAFIVFAVAAFAQLVVGYLVDHCSIRTVFAFVAGLQAVFFALMPGLTGPAALVVAIAFMLLVFGQIPINDVLVGRIARSEWRSRVYAVRYIVTFSVMASALPLIAWLHTTWGFAALFVVMTVAASCIFVAVLMLPRTSAVTAQASRTAAL
ncbi:MAG: MFS transporter [Deltaproteobacteria bacterium]|nr:MFS transporter [Deltaproteobacteria bacterium]